MSGTSLKGVPKAVNSVWKFVAGDQVMITRGRSKGRVARIAMVKRDGRTSARTGRRETKKMLLRRKENPRVYLDGGVHQGNRTLKGGERRQVDRPVHISNISHVVEKDGKKKAKRAAWIYDASTDKFGRYPCQDPPVPLVREWERKLRPKITQGPKFASADVVLLQTYFPPQRLQQSQAMPKQFSTFASQGLIRFGMKLGGQGVWRCNMRLVTRIHPPSDNRTVDDQAIAQKAKCGLD